MLFFLIAFFLYIDGVGTIIDNAINIGTDLNLNTVGQVVFLLATQVVAFGGSLVFAKLSKKYNTVTLILVCIAGYFGIALYALMLSSLLHFAILAFFIGCFQGSIQSLSRSYYSKIIPAENSGEYFLKRRVLPRLCGHRSRKACRRHHQRGGGMSRSVLCARLPLPAHCR